MYKKTNIYLYTIFSSIILLFALFVAPNYVVAANAYTECYNKDSNSAQKQCIIDIVKKECPKLKDSCVNDQAKKIQNAYDDAKSDCLQKNKNQPDKNEVCSNSLVSVANVKKGIATEAASNADGEKTETLPNEAEAQAYSCDGLSKEQCLQKNPIVEWINWGINILAGIVGLGAVLMVIWAGIQYTTARDNAQAVAEAKQKIINVVIGIAAFIFLYAFLNWLVPGGVFK
jgi:hypothetical protein